MDQACLLPRDRFWDIPVPKIDWAFDNLLVPQPSWSPSTTQQLRKLVAAPYLPPNDWTPRLDAYFVPVYKCQVIEIQLKNRKKTMRNPVQDGTIMI
ncbi:hypothetical protein [Thiolapillus sp.]|uniref:hypothetical protein n=1 Tax=Thiolapillus sp. TaxID=2017437 RepID=UPI0025D6DA00|nr:hypothetical protein [Thiolapillus sp.]